MYLVSMQVYIHHSMQVYIHQVYIQRLYACMRKVKLRFLFKALSISTYSIPYAGNTQSFSFFALSGTMSMIEDEYVFGNEAVEQPAKRFRYTDSESMTTLSAPSEVRLSERSYFS